MDGRNTAISSAQRIRSASAYALAALVAGLTACAEAQEPDAPPVVGEDILAIALQSTRPEELTLADDLAFFSTRLAGDPGDRLAWSGVLRASQLRFTVYGDSVDLRRAEAAHDVLATRWEPTPATHRAEVALALARHDFPRALDAARRAVREAGSGERDVANHMRLFDALFAVGDYESAGRILDLHFDEEALPYILREVRLEDRLGRTEKARDGMAQALERSVAFSEPRAFRAWTHTELGHFNHHTGRPAEAASHYLAALGLVPGAPAPLSGLGWMAFTEDRNPAAARALLEHALDNGAEAETHLKLREIALWSGDDQEARRRGEAFLRIVTSDAARDRSFWRPLARLLADDPDRTDEAVALAGKDLDQRPTSESYAVWAWALHKSGRTQEACEPATRSLEGVAPEPRVLYEAGVILLECDGGDVGRRLLEEAAGAETELGPRIASEIRQLLH